MRWLARTRGEQYVEVNYDLFRLPEHSLAVQVFVPRIWNALGESRPRLSSYFEEVRCSTVKCFNVPHIQHAVVQSLCNEGQEHVGCDIQCSKGYVVATNTLKCQAVDNMTPLGVWVGDASCTPVSCGVPHDVEHMLHGSVAQHFPNAALSTHVPLDIHWTDCVPGRCH